MTTSNTSNTKTPSILDTIEHKGYTQKLIQVQIGGSFFEEEEQGHHHSDASLTTDTLSKGTTEVKYKAVGLIGLVAW